MFHHLIASFCSIMSLTDPPELAHLPGDQALSVKSFIALLQSKIVPLKWILISETVQRGTRSKVIHLFLHDWYNWRGICENIRQIQILVFNNSSQRMDRHGTQQQLSVLVHNQWSQFTSLPTTYSLVFIWLLIVIYHLGIELQTFIQQSFWYLDSQWGTIPLMPCLPYINGLPRMSRIQN